MRSLRNKYKWLIDRLKTEFPLEAIEVQEFSYGCELGIAYKNGDKRHAVYVERLYNNGPVEYVYSLNDDPLKDKIVDDLIDEWKNL